MVSGLPMRDDPLPAFRSAADIRRQVVEALRPPRKISVSECAEQHRKIKNPGIGYSGPWKNELTPFLVEPMDRQTSRAIGVMAILGPSQFGKTEILLNGLCHGIKYRPADALVFQPTKDAAEDFANRRIKRFLTASPELGDQLGGERSDDQVLEKRFKNGMILSVVWPTATNLSSRSVPVVYIDERDRMTDDVQGEGDPVELARKRGRSFGRDAFVFVASTPSRNDGTGIIALFAAGEGNLWFWPCAECSEYFSPGFDFDRKPTTAHLLIPAGATPDQARDDARLVCPHCGAILDESHKAKMNARGLWLPRGMSIAADGTIHGARPVTRTASYWFHGLASPFVTWGQVAAELVESETYYQETGDETKLKAVANTTLGVPYRPRADGAPPPEADELRERCDGYLMGTVPAGVRFLTGQVDIQGDRFEVLVKGWNENAESWTVDRYAIRQLADGKTDICPGEYPEHWDELFDHVFASRYPLAEDPDRTLGIANVAIDTGGVDGVTENAKAFWKRARRRKISDRQITLIKGANTRAAPPIARPTFDLVNGKPNKFGPRVYLVGVHVIKDTLSNRLRRTKAGPTALHWPADFPERYFDELTAEEKVKGVWTKRRRANETWDLEVYSIAAWLRLRPGRINWDNPPAWALSGPPANDDGDVGQDPAEASAPVMVSDGDQDVEIVDGVGDGDVEIVDFASTVQTIPSPARPARRPAPGRGGWMKSFKG